MTNKNTGLISGLQQRQIGKTHGSIRGLLQLRTPSGPQQVESALESELVEQLNFSPHVRDLITQPIIEFISNGETATYASDVFIQLFLGGEDRPTYYLIEVKRAEDLAKNRLAYTDKFRGAEAWCAKNFAQFKVLTEKHIRTPYLANARFFSRHYQYLPDGHILMHIEEAIAHGPLTVARVIALLGEHGIAQVDGRPAIEQAIANWLIACDLCQPFTDSSLLSAVDVEVAITGANQPILKIIQDAEKW